MSAPLTRGLARNTLFNLFGWAWPILLALVFLPYIVSGLGNDAYGVFGLVSIVAGYLSILDSPFANGNVRFMAEAYGRGDWSQFRRMAVLGVITVGGLSSVGTLTMVLSAGLLARHVFKIPDTLVASATAVFRLAALSFLLNGVAGALRGILAATRRYDLLNTVNLVVGTLNTAGIVGAIWMGWGLQGAVLAQILSSLLGVLAFGAAGSRQLRSMPGSERPPRLDVAIVRKLLSFSVLLFVGQVAATIGLLIDRTLIGILLGTSAVTFYLVPTRITEKIPGLMASLSMALYPLSSEVLASRRMGELKQLYLRMTGLLLWISTFLATVLILLSRDILMLWVGPEFAANSWLVLTLLGAASVWRAPASVAFQVCNGLGRASVSMWISWGTLLCFSVPILILTPLLGIDGAALGVLLGSIPITLFFDLFVQRKLLDQRRWRVSLALYARPLLVGGAVLASSYGLQVEGAALRTVLLGLTTALAFAAGSYLLDRSLVLSLVRRIARRDVRDPGPRPDDIE